MRFEVAHHFEAPAEAVAAALLDPSFQASLSTVGRLRDRAVLESTELDAGRVRRRVRCVLDLTITGPARRFIGDGDPAWVQEETWDPQTRRWDWVIHPEVAGDLLSASGTTSIDGDGSSATRRVTGDVRVHVPLYGSRVEGWIVSGITDAYDEEAERLAQWLNQ